MSEISTFILEAHLPSKTNFIKLSLYKSELKSV